MNYRHRAGRIWAIAQDGAALILGITLYGFYVLHGLLRRRKSEPDFVADVLEQEDKDGLKPSRSKER